MTSSNTPPARGQQIPNHRRAFENALRAFGEFWKGYWQSPPGL